MSIPKPSLSWLLFLLLITFLPNPTNASLPLNPTRKLDKAAALKCGGCSPCGGATCYLSPPPPPPSLPPPPPPKKPPSPPKTDYCPPPPPPYSPGIIYFSAPPGSLYPVDDAFSGSTRILPEAFSSLLAYRFLAFLIGLWVQ